MEILLKIGRVEDRERMSVRKFFVKICYNMFFCWVCDVFMVVL